MKSVKSSAFGVAAIALAGAGCVYTPHAPSSMNMSASVEKKMGTCTSMSHDDMMKNMGCTDMMARMKMSEADMQKMMSCNKLSRDAMLNDERCVSLMKTHSDMMKMNLPN